MANQRGSSPGRAGRFDERAAIRDVTVPMPAGGGAAWERAGATFDRLGARLGQLADKAAAREGADAGTVDGLNAALPGEAGEKLARRRDGTIRGDAYDAAAMDTFMARADVALRGEVAAAYDNLREKPEEFEQQLGAIRAKYEGEFGDLINGDPQMAGAFAKRFEEQAFAYRRDIADRHRRRVLEEKQVALDERLTAVRTDLERRAELGGGAGDAALSRDLQAFTATLQAEVEAGVLTPKQAYAYRKGIVGGMAAGRVRGAARRMSPESQLDYADRLEEAFLTGDKAFDGLDAGDVARIAGSIRGEASRELARRKTGRAAAEAGVKSLLGDDAASIEATGQPLTLGGEALTLDRVAETLGPDAARAHGEKRAAALAYYTATADLKLLPAEDIAARVEGLQPKAGSPGFKAQADLADRVSREGERVLKARLEDPAAAVDDGIDPSLEGDGLIDARLSAQAGIGIPDYAQAPLTKREIRDLAGPVERASEKDQPAAIQTMLDTIVESYGKHSEAVLGQVLRTKGLDAEAARLGGALWRKIGAGERATPGEVRQAVVLDDTAASSRAVDPEAVDPLAVVPPLSQTPAPGQIRAVPQPSIQMLKANPALADEFDAKYGAGTAAFYLGQIRALETGGAP